MTRSFACLAFLVLSTSYAVGCGEDVGPCTDPDEGRDTVLNMGKIQYAGQAILNSSCATGCHSSSASGEARQGAPAGLDFDLIPVMEDEAKGKKSSTDKIVKLSSAQLAGLRKRQDIVYQNRDLIWQQVRDGLMPPGGAFAKFKDFATDKMENMGLFQSEEDSPCTRGDRIETLDSQHQVLRNWLACGAPIVESAGSVIKEGPVPGVVGYQYPMCLNGGPPPLVPEGEEITLAALLPTVLASCTGCHVMGLFGEPHLATFDLAKMALSTKDIRCNDKPWITPGKPEKSFLYDTLTKDKPGCKHTRMPWGSPPLTQAQIKQVETWIKNGAKMGMPKTPMTETPMEEPPETDTDQDPVEEPEPTDDAGEVEEEPDAAVVDAGRDAGAADAGRDAGRDAAVDAGRDAGRGLFPGLPFP